MHLDGWICLVVWFEVVMSGLFETREIERERERSKNYYCSKECKLIVDEEEHKNDLEGGVV